jgi:hypothetical protein
VAERPFFAEGTCVRASSALGTAKGEGLANGPTGKAGRTRWMGWVKRTAPEVTHLVEFIRPRVARPAPRGVSQLGIEGKSRPCSRAHSTAVE